MSAVFIPFTAAACGLALALTGFLRRKRSLARWCFVVGMLLLSLDSLLMGLSLRASPAGEMAHWFERSLIVKSCSAPVWLCFSLTYSRAEPRSYLARWKIPLLVIGLLPVVMSVGFREQMFHAVLLESPTEVFHLQQGAMATGLNALLLVALVMILMNLEQTFRSAAGTMRWRIKFVVLGLSLIFSARVYVHAQAILFSAPEPSLWGLESSALLIGCVLLAVAYARTGLDEVNVYPSLAVVRSSLTVLIVGAYLFVVGVLAQLVRRFGGAELFQFQALVLLLGMSGLALLLFSDRARHGLTTFAIRHFRKAQHDSVQIWNLFSRRLANVRDPANLCTISARLIAERLDVLSVSIWVKDEEREELVLMASTATTEQRSSGLVEKQNTVIAGLQERRAPFDLDGMAGEWVEEFRRINPVAFMRGGNRHCVPLRSGEETLGAIVLADRVNGAVYTVEELELLGCIADQISSVLKNLRLASEVARARELEAFRTMSAFLAHDLKNAAASLNLMVKNLGVHFDDPAFREDAMRGLGNTAGRIDDLIARLTALRQRPTLDAVEADLNQVVSEALDSVNGMANIELARELQPLPRILADREQIQSVVTNLVLNARDALTDGGRIEVRTEHLDGSVVLSVADNGCGMTQAFVDQSLFRPFHSTKKMGLGIGLFQSRAIVAAHGGGIRVQTELGKGTTFHVTLPVRNREQ